MGYGREGARVVLLDMNGDAAAEAAKEIRSAGGKADSFALDVTDRNACVAMAQQVADKVGPVLGPLLGYEVLTAFFLEAGFLGVALFGLAAARRLWPGIEDWDAVQSLSRLAVAATLTWAVWELARLRGGRHG